MTRDILFLDKDNTLGDFLDEGLYSGSARFLEKQKGQGQELYIATTACAGGREHLTEVDHLLSGYLGEEDISTRDKPRYVLSNGVIREIYNDYHSRTDGLLKSRRDELYVEADKRADRLFALPHDSSEREALQQEINDFFDYWHGLIHKETGEPFDQSTKYQNPHIEKGSLSKDIHLARRIISPQDPDSLRCVMVGDPGDAMDWISDPQTPIVVVSERVRSGDWSLVSRVLDRMYAKHVVPAQVYDAIFEEARITDDQMSFRREVKLEGHVYILENKTRTRRELPTRIICCTD